jgi:hypothetical protein
MIIIHPLKCSAIFGACLKMGDQFQLMMIVVASKLAIWENTPVVFSVNPVNHALPNNRIFEPQTPDHQWIFWKTSSQAPSAWSMTCGFSTSLHQEKWLFEKQPYIHV